jgi:hypothetical protein
MKRVNAGKSHVIIVVHYGQQARVVSHRHHTVSSAGD